VRIRVAAEVMPMMLSLSQLIADARLVLAVPMIAVNPYLCVHAISAAVLIIKMLSPEVDYYPYDRGESENAQRYLDHTFLPRRGKLVLSRRNTGLLCY